MSYMSRGKGLPGREGERGRNKRRLPGRRAGRGEKERCEARCCVHLVQDGQSSRQVAAETTVFGLLVRRSSLSFNAPDLCPFVKAIIEDAELVDPESH